MNCCTGLATVRYKKRDPVSCMHVHGMEIIEFSFFDKKRKIAVCENLAGGMLFLFWMSVCTHIYYICGCLNWFKCFTY